MEKKRDVGNISYDSTGSCYTRVAKERFWQRSFVLQDSSHRPGSDEALVVSLAGWYCKGRHEDERYLHLGCDLGTRSMSVVRASEIVRCALGRCRCQVVQEFSSFLSMACNCSGVDMRLRGGKGRRERRVGCERKRREGGEETLWGRETGKWAGDPDLIPLAKLPNCRLAVASFVQASRRRQPNGMNCLGIKRLTIESMIDLRYLGPPPDITLALRG